MLPSWPSHTVTGYDQWQLGYHALLSKRDTTTADMPSAATATDQRAFTALEDPIALTIRLQMSTTSGSSVPRMSTSPRRSSMPLNHNPLFQAKMSSQTHRGGREDRRTWSPGTGPPKDWFAQLFFS